MPAIQFSLPVAFVLIQALLASSVTADLRLASTPKNGFNVQNRNGAVAFTTRVAMFAEPATFNYEGLAEQKADNYDNFLRSNIDNEQDNRNFQTEPGRDMLPFRTLEAASTTAPVTVPAGVEQTVPLRWNNPHASEMEVNIWIMNNSVVVPVKKPVCAGEGHQDGVLTYTIPADFNTKVAATVPGFAGCTKVGDCTLQIYAHSVEPRTYSIGNPIIIPGFDANAPSAQDASGFAPATKDPGATVDQQPRDLCLPMTDPSSNIASAQPRQARQVSDVFNHAYQSSDFSPYSGQQQESISKNMQAATILRMTSGNRGELGKAALDGSTRQYINTLNAKVNNVVARLEQAANNVINRVLANTKTTGTAGNQQLANGFRVQEAGAVNARRLTTATYIPSFQVPPELAAQARASLNGNLKALMDSNNVAGIYVAALKELQPDFTAAAARGVRYQPAMVKSAATTMADVTSFRKVDANGRPDGGRYAAQAAFRTAGVRYLAALEDGSDAFDPNTKLDAADGETLAANPDDAPQTDSDATAGDNKPSDSSAARSLSLTAVGAGVVMAAGVLLHL